MSEKRIKKLPTKVVHEQACSCLINILADPSGAQGLVNEMFDYEISM